MEERKNLIQWIKEHKKELVISGISVGALILVILGLKNPDAVRGLWDSLKNVSRPVAAEIEESITKVTVEIPPSPPKDVTIMVSSDSPTLPFEVRRHIRNLPNGWHASPEKISEALANNIMLADGQTWVDHYTKGANAA